MILNKNCDWVKEKECSNCMKCCYFLSCLTDNISNSLDISDIRKNYLNNRINSKLDFMQLDCK